MSEHAFLEEYKKKEQEINTQRRRKQHFPVFVILLVRCLKLTKLVILHWLQVVKCTLFPVVRFRGYCPCCNKKTLFVAGDEWLRDSLRCVKCNSLPRDRQVYKYINKYMENRTDLRVLEFAPLPGAYMHDRKTKTYVISHYLPDEKFGKFDDTFYNEDIQGTTFPDGTFDLVIHEDILEHINSPLKAVKDSIRILADNGVLVFTCPVSHECSEFTKQRVSINESGNLVFYMPPAYHGNPIDSKGALVFWDFGNDFEEILKDSLPENVTFEHIVAADGSMGITGEMLDLFCIKKLPAKEQKKD